MKKAALAIALFALMVGRCHAVLYAPADEWLVTGPGGKYGVFSFHSEYSYIAFGPVNIEVQMGFESTRILFLMSLIVLIGSPTFVVVMLTRRQIRRTAEQGHAPDG